VLRLVALVHDLTLHCYMLRLLLVRLIAKHEEILVGIALADPLCGLLL
jgi:hypothetical protein